MIPSTELITRTEDNTIAAKWKEVLNNFREVLHAIVWKNFMTEDIAIMVCVVMRILLNKIERVGQTSSFKIIMLNNHVRNGEVNKEQYRSAFLLSTFQKQPLLLR